MILECDKCGFSRQVPDKYAGKTVKCPKCQASVTLGEAPPPEEAPADPEETVFLDRPVMPKKVALPRYSLMEFIAKTKQKDKGQGLFELESHHLLEVNLDGRVWTHVVPKQFFYNVSVAGRKPLD